MPEQILEKQSFYGVAALAVSATIWIYLGVVFLSWDYVQPFLTMGGCSQNDFGPCAMKKLVGPFIALLMVIILAAIPLMIFGVSTILGVIGCFQKTRKKNFAVAALIHIGAVIVLAGFIGTILSMLG